MLYKLIIIKLYIKATVNIYKSSMYFNFKNINSWKIGIFSLIIINNICINFGIYLYILNKLYNKLLYVY